MSPQSAEQVHAWISRHLRDRPHPTLTRPVNWFIWIFGITSILGAFSLISVVWPALSPVIQNRNLWAAISLILILLFTSGHMFNHIRKVPYVAGDGRGGVSYFAGGFSNQFGLETQIVAAMCKSRSLATFLRLTVRRWSPLLRNYFIGPTGAADIRSEDTAAYCPSVGRCNFLYV
jgi:oligosaccharyltransferase complex subunit gamma